MSDILHGNEVIFRENAYEHNTETMSPVNCLNWYKYVRLNTHSEMQKNFKLSWE